ncbi:MAG: hypothetical protein M3O26_10615 [Pseudomonadota bacterium]|nr:hypothetical protein [Pseudomonadota bacterium]
MNRRKFLALTALASSGALILPELIVPKRTFFLPPAAGWTDGRMSIRYTIIKNAAVFYGIDRAELESHLTDIHRHGGNLSIMGSGYFPGYVFEPSYGAKLLEPVSLYVLPGRPT